MFGRSHGYQPKGDLDPSKLTPPHGASSGGKKDHQIRYLGDLQRLDLKPGDKFVLTFDGPISMDAAKRIQQEWRSFVGGDENQFLLFIVAGGAKIGVISAEVA